jgi:hypothetical protein
MSAIVMGGERQPYGVAVPLKHLSPEAIEERAAKDMRSMSQYVTRVVVAEVG